MLRPVAVCKNDHLYHPECLSEWTRLGSKTCPECREALLPKLICVFITTNLIHSRQEQDVTLAPDFVSRVNPELLLSYPSQQKTRQLLRPQDEQLRSQLLNAFEQNDVQAARKELAKGATFSCVEAITSVSSREMFLMLLDEAPSIKSKIISYAIRQNQTEVLSLLLSLGDRALPFTDSQELVRACHCMNSPALHILLSHQRQDGPSPRDYINSVTNDTTPLMTACTRCNEFDNVPRALSCVRLLLAYGADPHIAGMGCLAITPFQRARAKPNQLLLDLFNAPSKDSCTIQ